MGHLGGEVLRLETTRDGDADATALVKIDLDRRLGEVDPRIYGGFVENLGRCIYGGIFDEGSPLADERGFRRDVVEAIRRLRPPVMRWGGNFSSGYHWTDGIGPRDQRPRRWDRAWQTEESNRFGTDEFVEFCRLVGAEPFICVNMGTGTLDEAMAWVEYCNLDRDTEYANLRRRNGHGEPHRVRYWGLGNEMYGPWQIGAIDAEEYVNRARELAKVMRWTDPEIELVASGEDGWTDWDRTVVDGVAGLVDWYSVHIYTGSEDYDRNLVMPHQVERAAQICGALIDRAHYQQKLSHQVHLAYDEWNQWFRQSTIPNHEERYTLADALAVATYLNAFIRLCSRIRMANLAQMVNVIAPIVTSPEGLFLQTIYHPLQLFAEHMLGTALDIRVDSPTIDLSGREEGGSRHRVADLGPFRLLDVSATYRPQEGVLALAAVNRGRDSALDAELRFADGAEAVSGKVFEVSGESPDSRNSFSDPEAVAVRSRDFAECGSVLRHRFPAHSMTVLRLQLQP
ncbi:MAG: alpha-N-arabinofuranosidase [Candidatus Nephthysia bennettiae]|nr:MAG: alpha-N-arabinofuranosidase [Candidatus Dormibacteraeota bacterium]